MTTDSLAITIQRIISKEIEELAAMTARGFSDLQNNLENSFRAEMKAGFDNLQGRIDVMNRKLDNHEVRLKRIESKLDDKAEKKDFTYLINILEKKDAIPGTEAKYLRYSNRTA